jgi:ATP-binding cassette, subfamily B, bacterial
VTRWVHFIRYLVGLSLRIDRRRTYALFGLVVATATLVPLFALGTRSFVNAVASADPTRAMVLGALVGVLWIASIAIGHLVRPVAFELGDLNLIAFDAELIELGGGSAGLEHLENPEYANRLELARSEGGDLFLAMLFLASVAGIVLQLAVTMVLLATVRPVLLLLPLFAIPAMIGGRWAQAHVDAAKARTAETARMSRHLLQLLTQAGPAKEIRVFGLGSELRRRQREAWDASTEELSGAELRAAGARSGGQLVFVIGYVGALVLVVQEAIQGQQSVGSVLFTAILASQITIQTSAIVLLTNQMQSMMRSVDGLNWLREAAARQRPTREPDLPVPDSIRDGLVFEDVSFSYPSSSRPILKNVDLRLPAGSVVALVGENGAGKSTLVKLIGRFYEPSHGTITLDGEDILRFELAAWRDQLTAAFQDFARLEVLARETVGVGDLPNVTATPVVERALDRAQAADVVATLPEGLETPLGRTWANGSELSGGQWQKLALGRAMMRERPLILLLDEPTAALDASAEHVLFERYAATARAAARTTGAITLLVSHRFSTVRMADLILVLADGEVVESGTHDELMELGGSYADLFRLQARAYG